MSGWRYFIENTTVRGGPGFVSLMRVRPDEPLLCAERLAADGRWHRHDQLFKQLMLGSDSDYLEVDEQRFTEALAGRIVTDESVGRPSAEEMARLQALEDDIAARWNGVAIPPGAMDLTGPPSSGTD